MSLMLHTDLSSRLGVYAAIAITASGIGAYIGYSLSKQKSLEKHQISSESSGAQCPFGFKSSSTPSGAKCPFSGTTIPSSTSNIYTHPNNPYANAKLLTPEQIALVKATAPVMAEHGVTITTHFYQRMFEKVPILNNIFNRANQATGEQPRALAAAVHAYAANIDNLGALGDAVNKIAQKHCSLNITADQYTIVGEHLIASVAEVLGPALDDKTAQAWIAAYAQLANILIGAEAKLYQDAAKTQGGWNGWRKFTIHQKVIESSVITSFYLRPSDSQPLPTCQPGQYISIKLYVPSLGYYQPRQYSLTYIAATSTTSAMYRISIKRESEHDISPAGVVSNLMHDSVREGDEIDVSHPMGEFTLKSGSTPVVLLSGGVGLTPMISMLQHIITSSPTRQTFFLHGTRDSQQHAMREYINDVVKTSKNVTKYVWYQSVNTNDVKGRDYDYTGRLNLSDIIDTITPLLHTADFYICGPVPFMHAHRNTLEKMGVCPSRIHTELFGTGANP